MLGDRVAEVTATLGHDLVDLGAAASSSAMRRSICSR
jgi:hypothetical protein